MVKNKSIKSTKKSSKKTSAKSGAWVKKTDVLGEVINSYPEIAPVLASSGLHCIGCHVSGYESIEQGCLAHGMSSKDVDELVKSANERIAAQNNLPQVSFSQKAVVELVKRKGSKKFVRLSQIFGGEFDFVAVDKKENDEVVIEVVNGVKNVFVVAPARIERMLRGVKIDYDSKQKDFVANRA